MGSGACGFAAQTCMLSRKKLWQGGSSSPYIHVFPAKGRARVVAPGADVRVVRDRTGVLAEWKATEAHMQCLADRADVSGSHTDWNFFCVRCLVTYANIELNLFVFCLSERTLMM